MREDTRKAVREAWQTIKDCYDFELTCSCQGENVCCVCVMDRLLAADEASQQDRIAALTAERDTLQATVNGLADNLSALQKRLPICPPCEIGEDSYCICEDALVPKMYLDETADRALKAEAERGRLGEALESVMQTASPCKTGGGVTMAGVHAIYEIAQAALAAREGA